jgi:ABC-type transport system involved in multi-copper enzyme maturation permease subunit
MNRRAGRDGYPPDSGRLTADSAALRPLASGFLELLRAEWTKFRTVPGWVLGMALAAVAIVGLGLGPSRQGSCGKQGPDSGCALPVGPGGEEVTDNFFFVHQPLAGDGSITVRVTSLTGLLPAPASDRDGPAGTRPGLAPWAKAGLIIKAGTRPGSAYAAVMVTGSHGVRMQDNYVHDTAGQPGAVSPASPRWLRLTRTGDTITGAESTDGTHWTALGTARLTGLPSTVQAGLFATSPQYAEAIHGSFGVSGDAGGPTQVTAAFDHLDHQGTWPADAWTAENIGGTANATALQRGGFDRAGGGFTVTGSGDIAPAVAGAAGLGTTITQTLVGTFAGLVVVVVVGTMFITAEYRRGLIRTTLAASPRRGRILAAKAVVVGAVASLVGLVSAALVVTLGQRVLRDNGVYVHPATTLTELRLVAGTAALLAVAAVLALAIGAVLRRSAAAVTAAIVVIILPYLLAISVLPLGAAQWLLRITPAAAYAVQQSAAQYPQVSNVYSPADGYFPLAPWAGLAVLGAWAAFALGLAVLLFHRRDA